MGAAASGLGALRLCPSGAVHGRNSSFITNTGQIMPIIRVEMFSGRTRDQKRALVRELTETFVRVAGGKPEGVTVLVQDVAKEDWAVAGDLMADKYPD
jgi:4-oxalocrotonate tautomerase